MQKDISRENQFSLNRYRPFIETAIALVAVAAVFYAVNVISDGRFLTVSNISVIVSHAIYPAFIAWGFCFLFACNYTDLSIGSVLVLGAFMTSLLGNQFGYPGVVIGGVLTGVVLVSLNFFVFVSRTDPSSALIWPLKPCSRHQGVG